MNKGLFGYEKTNDKKWNYLNKYYLLMKFVSAIMKTERRTTYENCISV